MGRSWQSEIYSIQRGHSSVRQRQRAHWAHWSGACIVGIVSPWLDTHYIFSVDEYFWENRLAYYAALDVVRHEGDDLTG